MEVWLRSRKIALDPASAARTTGKLPRIASDVDASPKTMRVYWHTIHWRRLLAAGVVLISLALFLPLVALSYLDRGIFSSNEIQEVGALSENEKIRLSVRIELRDLEKKRTNIRFELDRLQQEWDSRNEKIVLQKRELNGVKLSLNEAMRTLEELSKAKPALVRMPLSIPAEEVVSTPRRRKIVNTVKDCSLEQCFDLSRCPLRNPFQVFAYPLDPHRLPGVPPSLVNALSSAIHLNHYVTDNPRTACLFLHVTSSQAILTPVTKAGQTTGQTTTSPMANVSTLRYWNGDGANHLLLVLDNCTTVSPDQGGGCNLAPVDRVGRAIVARQTFPAGSFRPGFDYVMPTWVDQSQPRLSLPSILPARRKYLLSFSGSYIEPEETETTLEIAKSSLSDKYVQGLLGQFSDSDDLLHIRTNCIDDNELNYVQGLVGQWVECSVHDRAEREPLADATFALVMAPRADFYRASDLFTKRLLKVMRHGAIPVILGNDVELPFSQQIEWEKAAVILLKARAPELHLVLKTYSDADIVALRRQGRRLMENYLATPKLSIDTLLTAMRFVLKMPAAPERDEPSNPVANLSFGLVNQQFSSETDEMLGPVETSYSSLSYQRNFSLTLNNWRQLFNADFAPHRMAPWRPDDPLLPSDAKFRGSSFGFRPIGFGAGGSGKEFSEALGGNWPREQFTAVILTYERQQVLLEGISSLKGLPYLNKVVVVWNGPQTPGPETLTWPDIGVPIQVIKAPINSLNNRFVPWDVIETEAVLCLDDDGRLRHDELVFAFRVWRENRDRIVGFPGRFHAFDSIHKSWNYNSNHSCELSMVLTGAAFVHKFYLYAYTNYMQPEIRQIVDRLMNCEDIALNFLVSHLTRKPPLKVTSKWTFRCPGCPVALSEHDSHFLERHDCINKFSQIYGYNPLLYTQLRADSVLFKTRVPHDKQKCFKYV
ncbi:exostosin-like 3 isoform X2 [Varroa jacobsoni]|uniref:glucuronosyl-galactosyl-proteoglycan 4-alpha-N-acetylglucosaminyltransferase n=1 Tax=Varroa destructor TaxID=109461 RepID=A0A7M7JFZ5_VARDE|nr:exostosin-like 3 isoform X2 [Varroa destructor]XP_022702497.1 exostosin-like 3 isoform X2 [Varroa jacobsoni]